MGTFYISDLHLCHDNILKFEPRIRPFQTIEEMHEVLLQRWNEEVEDGDLVIVAGDVCLLGSDRSKLEEADRVLSALRGTKVLVAGNHDHGDMRQALYRKHFDKIMGAWQPNHVNGVVTHVPVHPSCLELRWEFNIHGHTHHHSVMREPSVNKEGVGWIFGPPEKDPRYLNVSCEAVDYRPRELWWLLEHRHCLVA